MKLQSLGRKKTVVCLSLVLLYHRCTYDVAVRLPATLLRHIRISQVFVAGVLAKLNSNILRRYTSHKSGLTSVVGTFFCSHTGTVFQAVPAAMSKVACAATENQA